MWAFHNCLSIFPYFRHQNGRNISSSAPFDTVNIVSQAKAGTFLYFSTLVGAYMTFWLVLRTENAEFGVHDQYPLKLYTNVEKRQLNTHLRFSVLFCSLCTHMNPCAGLHTHWNYSHTSSPLANFYMLGLCVSLSGSFYRGASIFHFFPVCVLAPPCLCFALIYNMVSSQLKMICFFFFSLSTCSYVSQLYEYPSCRQITALHRSFCFFLPKFVCLRVLRSATPHVFRFNMTEEHRGGKTSSTIFSSVEHIPFRSCYFTSYSESFRKTPLHKKPPQLHKIRLQ